MEALTRTLNAIIADPIASSFTMIIAVLFLIATFGLFLRSSSAPMGRFVAAAPALLTTMGVLGTFFGIFIGLLDFNVEDIDASVPQLLDGLKIAFSTSIVGLGSATAFRLIATLAPANEKQADVTPEMIHGVLADIRDDARANAEAQREGLSELRNSISSERDTSLLTLLQKMRSDIQDGNKELIEEFRSFAADMAENNSKALIDALQEVLRDFNAKINEQFGDNFKQLNEAVGALLEWQENYRLHLEQLQEQFERSVSAIQDSEKALTSIANSSASIPQTMAQLDSVIAGLRQQTDELHTHLEAVADLREKALSAFPTIEANLNKVTTDVAALSEKLVSETQRSLELQRGSFEQLDKGFSELQTQAAASQDMFQSEMQKTLQALERNVNKSLEDYAQLVDQTARESTEQIRSAWTRTEDAINKQIATLDEQMQNELTRVLGSMGEKLASLSEKFVADYTLLAERLSEVVKIAERARA
jgi:hypothetical protein